MKCMKFKDVSIKYLMGILEDVFIKIDTLYIPIDFVVMKMEEDSHI